MALFEPERHEPLAPDPVDDTNARAVVAELMDGVWDAVRPDGSWALHPLDRMGPDDDTTFLGLYLGTAGVLWATHWLQADGWLEPRDDLTERASALVEHWPPPPDEGLAVPSWFMGSTGMWAAALALGVEGLEDRLLEAIRGNRANATLEPLWGAPGTMVAARLVGSLRPDDTRFGEAHADSAEALLASLGEHDGVPMWTQDMYGSIRRFVGAGHGFVGNAHALLEPGDDSELARRLIRTVVHTARREGDVANWPPVADVEGHPLVQWCHGAPGVVTSLAGRIAVGLDAELDELLVAGGELTWRAGPLTKGPSLCHGTAGNGYPFLALYARTGDPEWLERAWAFAGHAVGQTRRMRAQHGVPRATLWTGDVGVALYVRACATADPRWPTLDVL